MHLNIRSKGNTIQIDLKQTVFFVLINHVIEKISTSKKTRQESK